MKHPARFAFISALMFAMVMALLPHPPGVLGNPGDKFQHMAAFGTLTILACAGWPNQPLLRIAERLSFVGAMIEVLQSIPALHRDCDITDWLADTFIILVIVMVVRFYRDHRPVL